MQTHYFQQKVSHISHVDVEPLVTHTSFSDFLNSGKKTLIKPDVAMDISLAVLFYTLNLHLRDFMSGVSDSCISNDDIQMIDAMGRRKLLRGIRGICRRCGVDLQENE